MNELVRETAADKIQIQKMHSFQRMWDEGLTLKRTDRIFLASEDKEGTIGESEKSAFQQMPPCSLDNCLFALVRNEYACMSR